MQGIEVQKSNIEAFMKGSMGWAANQVVFKLGGNEIPLRITAVFNNETEKWGIV